MSTFCIVITTDIDLSTYLIVINSQCAYFSGCYGSNYYKSQCVRSGWTRLQLWVWCPTCGFKLIARWYPQCCSCYMWIPFLGLSDDGVRTSDGDVAPAP